MDRQRQARIRRFYDGGTDGGAPDPASPPTIVLQRTLDMPAHEFRMPRRIAYLDREFGELLVPADPATFSTDLTSVPPIFGWLVPRTGKHLPAALIHDGLVGPNGEPPTYLSTEGVDLDREQANRVFRDAMVDTGTGLARRWLMWSAVTLATLVTGQGTRWSVAERWRWRVTVLATIAVVLVLGIAATLDLFDVAVPLVGNVAWMGVHPWWMELATGAAGGVVIPLVLALAWGRFRIAGIITGVGLALLLHVTLAILVLSGIYLAVEWLCARAPRLALVGASTIVLVAAGVFVVAL